MPFENNHVETPRSAALQKPRGEGMVLPRPNANGKQAPAPSGRLCHASGRGFKPA